MKGLSQKSLVYTITLFETSVGRSHFWVSSCFQLALLIENQ
jgi:hypothetical protein